MEIKNIKEAEADKQTKFEVYKKTHKTQIEMWMKAHPQGPNPPIYWDDQINQFRWLSRQERRAMEKNENKPTKSVLVDQHGRDMVPSESDARE